MTTTAAVIIGTRVYSMQYHAGREGEKQRVQDAARTLMRKIGITQARISYDITSGITLPISTEDQEGAQE